jgi:hypothetical protein
LLTFFDEVHQLHHQIGRGYAFGASDEASYYLSDCQVPEGSDVSVLE